ncbi:DUF4168 domain-containing protein [Novosphingobium endophyticum]|nr:DUF4168 domain-containing protein [Novosphingobium endophyticum]
MRLSKITVIGAAVGGMCTAAAHAAVPEAGGTSPQAQAQQPSAPPPATSAPSAGTPGAVTSETTFSDEELEQFARAAMAIQQIEKDPTASAEDKQPKMAAAVQASGLTPQKFNEIAAASQSDAALMQRIQMAAGKIQGANSP